MKKRVCFVVTDSISFNILCRGQLEFFKSQDEWIITLLCGGSDAQIQALKDRGVGRVIKIPFERRPRMLRDLVCLFRMLIFFSFNKFDLVVYSTPKALLLTSIASFVSGNRNRVALVRGRVYENFTGGRRFVFKGLDKLSLGLSTHVIFISRSLMEAYQNEGIDKNRKGVVLGRGSSNGIDTAIYFPPPASVYRQGDVFSIVVVGRICRDKGIQELKKVIDIVNARVSATTVRFTLIGNIEDDYSRELINDVTQNSNVTWLDFSDQIAEIFRGASLHLFLSHREGFGNVALEAAACGVPTFGFDVVGVRDSISKVSGATFPLGDVDGVADGIIQAIKSPTEFRDRYRNAAKWASDNYEAGLVWRNYYSYYEAIMSAEGPK